MGNNSDHHHSVNLTLPPPPPIIVAMKGHPGTGKTTLARSLASTLKIPLIDKDDVRDSTAALGLLQSPPPSSTAAVLNDLSYDVVWRVASTQLQLGLSVIVDSPLSRRAHLDRLLHVAASASAGVGRLVIVECKPSDESLWRRRLEERGEREGGGGGHKPSTWRDLRRLIEGYQGCHEYDAGEVPKLVVDTTSSSVEQLVAEVMDFIEASCSRNCSKKFEVKSC